MIADLDVDGIEMSDVVRDHPSRARGIMETLANEGYWVDTCMFCHEDVYLYEANEPLPVRYWPIAALGYLPGVSTTVEQWHRGVSFIYTFPDMRQSAVVCRDEDCIKRFFTLRAHIELAEAAEENLGPVYVCPRGCGYLGFEESDCPECGTEAVNPDYTNYHFDLDNIVVGVSK